MNRSLPVQVAKSEVPDQELSALAARSKRRPALEALLAVSASLCIVMFAFGLNMLAV